MRHGVPLPELVQDNQTVVRFCGREYLGDGGPDAAKDAACSAYTLSGVFGKVVQRGFLVTPVLTQTVIVDFSKVPKGTLEKVLEAYPKTHVAVFVGPEALASLNIPDAPPYTLYHTVHPGESCIFARIEWYINTHGCMWRDQGTCVHVFSERSLCAWADETCALLGVEVESHVTD